MTGVVVLIGICLVVSAMLIYGALCRIAECVEAQNRHYGVGVEKPAEREAA